MKSFPAYDQNKGKGDEMQTVVPKGNPGDPDPEPATGWDWKKIAWVLAICCVIVAGAWIYFRKPAPQPNCPAYAEQYDFPLNDNKTCNLLWVSENLAKTRLAELRALKEDPESTGGKPVDFCALKLAFEDAVDLEKWFIQDPDYRAKKLKIDDNDLRNIRLFWTREYGVELSNRVLGKNFSSTYCERPNLPENLVFTKKPAVEYYTTFSFLSIPLNEVHLAWVYRRPIPVLDLPKGILTKEQVSDARQQFYKDTEPKPAAPAQQVTAEKKKPEKKAAAKKKQARKKRRR